ncbi:MAG: serine--tRNA ligase [Acidobacteriota bacterium]
MLARERLRAGGDDLNQALVDRGVEDGVLARWTELDLQRRESLGVVEEKKRQRNESSKQIGQLKQAGEDADEQIAAVGALKKEIEALEQTIEGVETELETLELSLPNVGHESTPVGASEEDNVVVRTVGELPELGFEAAAHWDVGPELGVLDFERGAKLAGARFTTYRGLGARLERALANFMLDLHGRAGYVEALPPLLVNEASMLASGQLPKFADDAFRVENHGYYLIPTSEVPLVNLHRGETLDEDELPLRYTAWTPCFRAEAGSYGKDVRGLIRQHQFFKVELVQITHPEQSYEALEQLTTQAESVLQALELPYRVMALCTGDMGFTSAKTYDLEVWLPGQGAYREISSCSNCEDFQARRANIRFKPAGGKPQLVHTLNGSGLATGRTVVAILENYQQEDGTVRVPEALQSYLGGVDLLTPSDS